MPHYIYAELSLFIICILYHHLSYPLIKNCCLVTESKNLDPLATIGFNAQVKLTAQSNKVIAEIFIFFCKRNNKKVQKQKKRSLSSCSPSIKKKGKNVMLGEIFFFFLWHDTSGMEEAIFTSTCIKNHHLFHSFFFGKKRNTLQFHSSYLNHKFTLFFRTLNTLHVFVYYLFIYQMILLYH